MKPVPLPLPRCGGRRVGFGGFPVAFILILGTVLLFSVSADALTCLHITDGSKDCGAVACCQREFKGKDSGKFGCNGDADKCKEAKCEKVPNQGKNAFKCFCAGNECNKADAWLKDPVYIELTAGEEPGPGASTTPSSKSNAAVISGLLVVITALGSLPHLITALI